MKNKELFVLKFIAVCKRMEDKTFVVITFGSNGNFLNGSSANYLDVV